MTGNMDILENMRKMLEAGEISKEDIVRAFPKLNESDDEMIRKALLRCCDDWEKGQFGCMAKEDVPAIRAYLEKQKEQRPTPKFKIGDVVRDTNHNGQPVYRIVSMDRECYICESDDQSLGDRAVVHFTLDNPYLRLVKQKPAEWSDSVAKEMFIKALERAVEQTKKGYELTDCDKHSWWEDFKAYSGIKSAEWSEEDEMKIVELKTFIAQCNGFNKENRKKAFNMIDSLRPQQHWKPSEEQMKALRLAYEDAFECPEGCVPHMPLKSLLSDIQKLL